MGQDEDLKRGVEEVVEASVWTSEKCLTRVTFSTRNVKIRAFTP